MERDRPYECFRLRGTRRGDSADGGNGRKACLHAMSLSEASVSFPFAALRLELDVAYYETTRGA